MGTGSGSLGGQSGGVGVGGEYDVGQFGVDDEGDEDEDEDIGYDSEEDDEAFELPEGGDGSWDESSELAQSVPFSSMVQSLAAPLRAIEQSVRAGAKMYAKPVPRLEEVNEVRRRKELEGRSQGTRSSKRPRALTSSLVSRICKAACCNGMAQRTICCGFTCCSCGDTASIDDDDSDEDEDEDKDQTETEASVSGRTPRQRQSTR